MVLLLAAALAAPACGPDRPQPGGSDGPTVVPTTSAAGKQALAGHSIFADLARQLKPTVVNLQVSKPAPLLPPNHPRIGPGRSQEPSEGDPDPYEEDPGPPDDDSGQGSGVIIDSEGLILTNNHVVEGADTIDVILADATRLRGKLVGTDPSTDLALVRVEPLAPLTAAKLGSSANLEVGDWVLAIGNPYGLEATVTVGVLSGTGRVLGAGPYDDFLQTDASINPGNSGGPLFDLKGEVVGINTAILPYGQGLGFSIPIDLAREVLPQLQANGQVVRGFIGLGIQELSPRLRDAFRVPKEVSGALVSSVLPGGPSDRAGARIQDVVLSWNGKPITTHRALLRAVAATPVGKPATLSVFRNGRTMDLLVLVARRPAEEDGTPAPRPAASPKPDGELGLEIGPLDAAAARRLGTTDLRGVVVRDVRPGSPAWHGELFEGDIIRRVGALPVADVAGYRKALRDLRGETVALLVEREGSTIFVALDH